MFAISCSACQKKLSVKDDVAGKKVKCPGCGHVTTVPSQTAPVGNGGTRTVPPASIPDGQTISPKPADASNTPTNPSLSKPDATQDAKNDSSHDSSLTEFLAPPQADDELGRLGQYRILKILGHGGMGVVFLGEDPKLGRKVAIKAMLPHLAQSKSSQQRFLREARAAAALEHDHIVAIHHVDEDRGAPYIVMPFLKGQPLDEHLKSGMPLSLYEILRIGREVACALGAAHEAGLIHRDIKPANIWLEAPHARVKILDFGLARAVTHEADLTQQGVIVGTPAYMAPEQGRGESVDHRCDLFSLGVVLYRLCTGKMPFHGKDSVSTLMAVAMHEPPAPIKINEKLPQELSDLVMKLLEKKPADRMSNAAEVVQLLHAIETKSAAKMAAVNMEALDAGEFRSGEPRGARGERASDAARFSGAAGSGGGRRSMSLVAVALLAVFGVLALGVGGVYYWQTNNGTVRIEINDPDIKVAFDKNGPIITGVDKQDIKLTPGEFGLRVERGDLKFDTDKFILKKGETITLKIEWFKEGKLQVMLADKVIGGAEKPVATAKAIEPPIVAKTPARRGLQFEGTDQFVRIAGLQFDGNPPLSIEGWITPLPIEGWITPVPDLNGVNVVRVGDWDGPGFSLKYNANGYHANLAMNANPNDWQLANASIPKGTNRRDHVAVVWDGKMIRCFVNGKPGEPTQLTPNIAASRPKGGMSVGFGQSRGIVEEVRVSKSVRYAKSFTPESRFEPDADTLALYHMDEGSGDVLKDSSGNGHHGKIVGAKWVRADEAPASASPPATSEGPADPERKAAESLIPFANLTLKLKSGTRTLTRSSGNLPSEPFKVTAIAFSRYGNKDLPATFVGATLLPAIAQLQSLTHIWNHQDQVETVTGEEFARLSKMPAAQTIKHLGLRFQLTSSAVDSLARFSNLESLDCLAEQTDGDTLRRLKELPKLKYLGLLGLGKAGPVSDKGIDDLCSLELTGIEITRSKIVDARLAGKLANMPRVDNINLLGSQVDDEIIAVLARGTAKLITLNVSFNPVTDAGLAHLKAKATLRLLRVSGTKVTEAGAMELSDALPKCKIDLGGGKVIGPKDKTAPPPVDPDDPTPEAFLPPLDPERKAAESLIPFADLTLVLESGKRTFIRSGEKLPSGPFKVTQIGYSRKDLPATFVGATLLPAIAEFQSLTHIWNNEMVTGEELARLSKMPAAKTIKLLWLRFQFTSSALDSLCRFSSLDNLDCLAERTDRDTLGRLRELPKLKLLSLSGLGKAGPLSDKGIDDLCSLKLASIGIKHSTIVDARFAGKLASMPRVEHITLIGSQVDDEIIAVLARGTAKLITLNVSSNTVTDAGLAHLKAKPTLRVVRVSFTKVTEAGAMKLSDALPKCKIELGGGKVIGPRDKTSPPPVDPDDPTPEGAMP